MGYVTGGGSTGSGGAVSSVAGRTGDVTLAVADVAGAAPTANPTFTGTVTLPTGAVTSTMIADGTLLNADVNAAAAIAVTKIAAGTDTQVLTTSGSTVGWAAAAGGAPSGAAGGDLAGTYPNPTIGTGRVTSTMLLDGTILNADINASAAIALSKVAAPGSAGDLVGNSNSATAAVKRTGSYTKRTGAVAENFSRVGRSIVNLSSALTSGKIEFVAIELYAGQVISNITFMCGTTAANTSTHCWFALTDSSRVQVATTSDDTSATWTANTERTTAIATIASGASGTYTVPSDGLYYAGICVVATTMPTLLGTDGSSPANLQALTPILAGQSDSSLTSPPSFARTYGAFVATARQYWVWVS